LGRRRMVKFLVVSTLAYLVLPLLIFCLGWIRPAAGCALAAAVTCGAWSAGRALWPGEEDAGDGAVPRWKLLVSLMAGFALCAISGAGGWGLQDSDWVKHNVVLKDLIDRSWPVCYDLVEGRSMLTYYIAYYLPGAVVGRMWGWVAANHATFLYTLAGLWLALLWLPVLTRRDPLFCTLVFVAFSGLDFVAALLAYHPGVSHLEIWAGRFQYSCYLTLLFWTPHQALPAWLLTSLALRAAAFPEGSRSSRLAGTVVFLVGAGALWAPFPMLGLAVLAGGMLAGEGLSVRMVRRALTPANAAGLAVGFVVFLYYLARVDPSSPARRMAMYPPDRLGLSIGSFGSAVLLLLFLLLEVAVILVPVWVLVRGRSIRRFLAIAGGLLVVLPFLHYGRFNDLVMRASVPAAFVLMVCAVDALLTEASGKWARRAAVFLPVVFTLGAITPAYELRRHLRHNIKLGQPLVVGMVLENRVGSLLGLQVGAGFNLLEQYTGAPDGAFGRYLAARRQPPAGLPPGPVVPPGASSGGTP